MPSDIGDRGVQLPSKYGQSKNYGHRPQFFLHQSFKFQNVTAAIEVNFNTNIKLQFYIWKINLENMWDDQILLGKQCYVQLDVVTSALLYLRVEPWHDPT